MNEQRKFEDRTCIQCSAYPHCEYFDLKKNPKGGNVRFVKDCGIYERLERENISRVSRQPDEPKVDPVCKPCEYFERCLVKSMPPNLKDKEDCHLYTNFEMADFTTNDGQGPRGTSL